MSAALRFSKEYIIHRLRERVQKGETILACGVGNGLIARIMDKNDVDLLVVYNSGRYRMEGIASIAGNLPIGDANRIVYEMGAEQILHRVSSTPVVAGVYGVDPTRDIKAFLNELAGIGYSGVINFPTVGKLTGGIRQELEEVGLGFDKEIEMLRMAADIGFLTMAYCYTEREAKLLAEAGVDVLVAHVGLTAGGDVGVKRADSLESTIEKTQAVLTAGLSVKPDMIPLCHGGAISTPADVREVLKSTCAVGFVGASTTERLPIETAVPQVLKEIRADD